MHNMPNIVTSLPLDVEDLCDTLKIVFVGAQTPNRVELRKISGVSREKIRSALSWLKKHNHMYRTIPIMIQIVAFQRKTYSIFLVDEANIAKLPEDDVPECIWTTIERAENIADGDAERAGLTVDPVMNAFAQGEANPKNNYSINTR